MTNDGSKAVAGLSPDWFGGVIVVAIGTLAVAVASTYTLGTAENMGPGYFPVMLGVLTICFGVGILVVDTRKRSEGVARPALRPLLVITSAILIFAAVVDTLGLAPACFLAALISTFADKNNQPRRALVLAAVLATLAVLTFKYALGVPAEVFTW